MSSFTSPLIVSPMPNGRDWRLMRKFSYRIGPAYSGKFIRVPKDFQTDFASIPKFLWVLPRWAKYHKGAVLHDWLYRIKRIMGKPITRKKADQVFLEAMLAEWRFRKSRYFIARIEYWAVRWFGWLAWKREKSNSS